MALKNPKSKSLINELVRIPGGDDGGAGEVVLLAPRPPPTIAPGRGRAAAPRLCLLLAPPLIGIDFSMSMIFRGDWGVYLIISSVIDLPRTIDIVYMALAAHPKFKSMVSCGLEIKGLRPVRLFWGKTVWYQKEFPLQ